MKAFKHCGPNPNPMTRPEAIALADCVKQLPPNPVIVQIGAFIGVSTIAMLETRPDAFIFSIDIKPHPEERANLIDAGLDHLRVVRILGDSQQMDWPWLADMIFFDGDHRYNGIKADCQQWLGKVKSGGLIIFHDYILKNAPPKNQVAQVVNEFFAGIRPFMQVKRLIGFKDILIGFKNVYL